MTASIERIDPNGRHVAPERNGRQCRTSGKRPIPYVFHALRQGQRPQSRTTFKRACLNFFQIALPVIHCKNDVLNEHVVLKRGIPDRRCFGGDGDRIGQFPVVFNDDRSDKYQRIIVVVDKPIVEERILFDRQNTFFVDVEDLQFVVSGKRFFHDRLDLTVGTGKYFEGNTVFKRAYADLSQLTSTFKHNGFQQFCSRKNAVFQFYQPALICEFDRFDIRIGERPLSHRRDGSGNINIE